MRKIARLSLVAGAAAAVIGGAMIAAPSNAASTIGGQCDLAGDANFHPGPGIDPAGAFAYDFSGNLSGCHSDAGPTGDPTTGVITAGQGWVDDAGVTHAEPVPQGTGSCGGGETEGISFVKWSDGAVTIIDYTTASAAAGVVLEGQTLASYDFGDGFVLNSTRYTGDNSGAVGVLQFDPDDPTQCAAGGVTHAGITGETGVGTAG